MIRAEPRWVNGWPVVELDCDGDELGCANVKAFLSPDQAERLVAAILHAINKGKMVPDWASGKMRRGVSDDIKRGGGRSG